MRKTAHVAEATAHFEKLLREQLARAEKMANAQPPKDFKTLDKITVGFCGGDGIGPIIMKEARRVLEALLAGELAKGRLIFKDIEGLTIENRTAQGKAIPDDVLAQIKTCDVILKGPTETPKGAAPLKAPMYPCAGSWTSTPMCAR